MTEIGSADGASYGIGARLRRRFVVMTADRVLIDAIQRVTPEGWGMAAATDLAEVGEWQEILLHRFLLLDLDEREYFHPVEVLEEIRTRLQINIPVFGFGGDQELRAAARLARCDRFFGREEMVLRLPDFFTQFGWG